MLQNHSLGALRDIPGIGPKRLAQLKEIGVNTPLDLIYRFPKHYVFRKKSSGWPEPLPLHDILLEVEVVGKGSIWRRGRRSMVRLPVMDQEGNTFFAVWFNQPYRRNQFPLNSKIWIEGRCQLQNNMKSMLVKKCGAGQPEYGLQALYDLPKGISQLMYGKWLKEVLNKAQLSSLEIWPKVWLERLPLNLPEAMRKIHLPQTEEDLNLAQKRFIFDETLAVQLLQQSRVEDRIGFVQDFPLKEKEKWLQTLPFELTGAQKRTLKEIEEDMKKPYPMARFLQGDVGSGKTVVAAAALLQAVSSGNQAIMLAPTEILARQHYESLRKFLPESIDIYLLTGKLKTQERRLAQEAAEAGQVGIWVGTHALLSEGFEPKNLSLLVVDEQHRFGVLQRQKLLKDRRPQPDLLTLSATPIPRTLALLLYGDMEISLLDEMPPNRLPIKTVWLKDENRVENLLKFTSEEIDKGHSVYWVCPSIEVNEDENYQLPSIEEREPILQQHWPPLQWGVLHGRMKPEEREVVMDAFEQGSVRGLLATTVIEVGVDQPKATVMVVEGADRFGLAQLHQLRGRVGRSDLPSYCALITQEKVSETAKQRLQALCDSQDGFYLAQLDLELRGPGEILGTSQSGYSELLVFRWQVDEEILQLSQLCHQEFKQGKVVFSPEHWQALLERFDSGFNARKGG